jgi:NAD(P)H-hydrate epimerase
MIPHFTGNLPHISVEQMKKVEQSMIENYGISRLQMMENAGLNLASLAREKFLYKKIREKKVIVVAGTDQNAGCVLVAARHLSNWGVKVSIVLSDTKGKFTAETIAQFSICQKMKIPFVDTFTKPDLIIEGIKDAGFTGDPKEDTAKLIDQINNSGAPVVSIEAPTGLDLDTGNHGKPTVKAKATMALGIPKAGMFKLMATKYTGELFLADISVPPELYKSIQVETTPFYNVFSENPLVKINKVIILS